MAKELLAYIRENQGVTTRKAIISTLLEQGYSQEEIDEAWKTVEKGEKLLRYIAGNRDTYTRNAITSQLLQQGYSMREIDDAWAILERVTGRSGISNSIPSQENVWRNKMYWFTALGFFPGVPVIIGLISRAFRGKVNYFAYDPGFALALFMTIIAILACLYAMAVLWNRNRAISRGLLLGLLLFLIPPFIGVFIIYGICTAG